MATLTAYPLLALVALAVVVVAFFIGAVNPASIIAKVLGKDLSQGSGNPGATNAGRVVEVIVLAVVVGAGAGGVGTGGGTSITRLASGASVAASSTTSAIAASGASVPSTSSAAICASESTSSESGSSLVPC